MIEMYRRLHRELSYKMFVLTFEPKQSQLIDEISQTLLQQTLDDVFFPFQLTVVEVSVGTLLVQEIRLTN